MLDHHTVVARIAGALPARRRHPVMKTDDPIFAAIEEHRRLAEASNRLYGALDIAQSKARKKHGSKDQITQFAKKFSASRRSRDLNRLAINTGSKRRSTSIKCNDALILPHRANPAG